MKEWLEELISSPFKFYDSWVKLCNGGLWTLCQRFLEGDIDAKDNLQRLRELLEKHEQEFAERLEWFLKEQNLPTNFVKQLLITAIRMIDDFLIHEGGNWSNFLTEDPEDEIPRIELQGLGIQQGVGFAVRLSLELRESPDRGYHFLPHPACCLIPQDNDFQKAVEYARRWWIEKSDFANFPAQITWRIYRIDGRPLVALRGDSLGGLFAVGICHLMKSVPIDQTVSISAAISPEGSLHPVSGLNQKLHAAHQCIPPLRVLIVANEQNLTDIPQIQSISIQTAASVSEAFDFFATQSQNFVETRERIKKLHNGFRVFNETLDWSCYQEPTLTVFSEGSPLSLTDWLRAWLKGEEKHWLLVGTSGMGKTTALRFIAYHIAATNTFSHLLPVYLRADEWRERRLSLPEVLENSYRSPSAPSQEEWRKWAELGRLVLLVDQLERAASDLDFLDQIRMTIKSDYPNIYLLIATRSEKLSSFKSLELPIVQLEPFSETQAKDLLQRLSRALNKPLPSFNISLGGFSPFLLVALLLVDYPPPKGQGELYLKLLEFLLSKTDLPLPTHRVIEILSEVSLSFANKDQWTDRELYESLRDFTSSKIADQIWMAIKDRLLVRMDGFYSFVHTLILEALRAYALAHKWRQSNSNVSLSLTPLRAILVASLLDSEALPDFWRLLQRKMESEPSEWAEVVAQCLNERTDYPEQIINLLLSHWFDAFLRGTNERDGWDRAIAALSNEIVEKFLFNQVQQKLTSRSLADLKSATRLLKLVAHRNKIPATIAELLAKACMDEFGFAILNEVKEILCHCPLQCEIIHKFISTITAFFDSPLMFQRSAAIKAIGEIAKAGVLTEDLKSKIANRLKEIVQAEESHKIRSVAQKTLLHLKSICSS
ncbi:MAG: NACHT domain-containing protein [Armatimonadota bacterium]|nr:NACHT domain-containing protein [Armatimonadota bacterium]MDW8144438.1 NACHT domain-containing protein [Armatimonadota bacterium]